MAKFIMNGARDLVVWHQNSLKTFAPGTIIEAGESPHEWFDLLEPPTKKKKEAPIKVKKEVKPVTTEKSTPLKIDLPTEKF